MTPTGYVRKYAYDPGGVRVLSFYVRTWRVETIEAATFKQLRKAVQVQVAHASLSMYRHLTSWKAGMKNQRLMTKWSALISNMQWTHSIANQALLKMVELERIAQHRHETTRAAVDMTAAVTAIQYGQGSPKVFEYAEHLLPQLLAEVQALEVDPIIACIMASQKARWGSPWVFSPSHPNHPNKCSLDVAIQQHNKYMAAYDEHTAYRQAWYLLEGIHCNTSFDHQVQELRDVLQDKISANDPFLQLEIEANQIMMESALGFLKEAIAHTRRNLLYCTIAGLTGDIMYFMLIDEIARAQSSNTSKPTPADCQWHNMNRKDDKMAQNYLDALQHQFVQAIKVAQAITTTREFMANHDAIRHWATTVPGLKWRSDEQPHIPHNHCKATNIISGAYCLIQTTPREGNQHHVTLMGNDIQDIAMASDDPLMAPDEHDLALFQPL